MTRPAVFLDRDGTLNAERGYCADPAGIAPLPGVAAALAALRDAGRVLVVVSNQSGVARGLFDERAVARVHAHLHAALGGAVTAWLHCPHHPTAGHGSYTRPCDCRKPAPGMLRRAARLLDLDPARSWTVGDAARDVLAGRAAGTRTCLVRCGHDADRALAELEAAGCRPDLVCADLPAALPVLLA